MSDKMTVVEKIRDQITLFQNGGLSESEVIDNIAKACNSYKKDMKAVTENSSHKIENGIRYEVAINLNTATNRIFKELGHHAFTAWMLAIGTLKVMTSRTGPQIVTIPMDKPRYKTGAAELVKAGLLKPYAGTTSKYTLPRKFAFASWEPSLNQEGVLNHGN